MALERGGVGISMAGWERAPANLRACFDRLTFESLLNGLSIITGANAAAVDADAIMAVTIMSTRMVS